MDDNFYSNRRISLQQSVKNLSKEDKIKYLCIALRLQGFTVNDETCDRIIESYEAILRLGGNFSVNDSVEIQLALDRKYAKKRLNEK